MVTIKKTIKTTMKRIMITMMTTKVKTATQKMMTTIEKMVVKLTITMTTMIRLGIIETYPCFPCFDSWRFHWFVIVKKSMCQEFCTG